MLVDKDDVMFYYRIYNCIYRFSVWKVIMPISALMVEVLPNIVIVIATVLILIKAKKAANKKRLKCPSGRVL